MSHKMIIRNRLLSLMTVDDFDRIAGRLEHVNLVKRFELSSPAAADEYCYFLESGLGSVVAISANGRRAEVGLFGRDGMSPTALVLGANSSPHEIFMQVGGEAYRIESQYLRQALDASATMRNLLSRYAQAMSVQASFTALSNAVNHIDERLARWILMAHDRSDGDQIALTHEFLAMMLAVRRPSVTVALHALEGRHLIISKRGIATVKDRAALESFAGGAYGSAEAEYARLIGI